MQGQVLFVFDVLFTFFLPPLYIKMFIFIFSKAKIYVSVFSPVFFTLIIPSLCTSSHETSLNHLS